jgi:Tfp pilus assembly protein FimT
MFSRTICAGAILTALGLNIAQAESIGGVGRGASAPNPYANNASVLVVPNGYNDYNQPQTNTITYGPNGLTTLQSGNTSTSSNGMSSITNGNRTIYSNGVTCTNNGGKRTCN